MEEVKTPEQMAEKYANDRCGNWNECERDNEWEEAKRGFFAGYQAAKDKYKEAIDTYNDVAKQMMEEAVRILSPKNELAADKVMNSPKKLGGWISVKDQLPEVDDWVIGYYSMWYQQGQSFVGAVKRHEHPRTKESYWTNTDATNDGGYEEVAAVTYWMPLPSVEGLKHEN